MVILLAEDESALRSSLQIFLSRNHVVLTAANGAEALELAKVNEIDLLITDHQMPGMTGLELVKKVKELAASPSFLLMTAFASIDHAIEAIRLGAEDYLVKPFDLRELDHRIRRIEQLRNMSTQHELKRERGELSQRMSGRSENVKEANVFIEQVAPALAPVLIVGPSGSGKEVMAKAIHEAGPRALMPFVAINCASLSESLIESELFGHEKGAFTGAIATKPGKFELAKGGTIFLDEIGELSQNVQARLLRVVQEKEFYRVGGTKQIRSDARIVAATHRPLKKMVKDGTFREDLFFRLSVLNFELKSLGERREDLPVLVDFFWDRFNRECGKKLKLAEDVRSALAGYSFPGNIRELQNILERMVVLAKPGATVTSAALPLEVRQVSTPSAPIKITSAGAGGLNEEVERLEKRLISEALAQTGGNQAQAADLLKLNRGSLHYKLKKYQLGEPNKVSRSEDEAA